jgi:hypothetical protein
MKWPSAPAIVRATSSSKESHKLHEIAGLPISGGKPSHKHLRFLYFPGKDVIGGKSLTFV